MDTRKFKIVKVQDGWIVKRINGAYRQHAHFKDEEGCERLLKFLKANKLPYNKYYRGSCKRLLTNNEYKNLKPSKDRYYNIGG